MGRGFVAVLLLATASWASATGIEFYPPKRFPLQLTGGLAAPALATDGGLTWVLVWQRANEIWTMRSTDGAGSWSAPAKLHVNANGEWPRLTTDGTTWLAVWVDPSLTSSVVASRSVDGGSTWTAPTLLDAGAPSDGRYDDRPVVATGGGVWGVAWSRFGAFDDYDLWLARSLDGGSSWSAPVVVNSDAATDGTDVDNWPALATDGAGTWVVAWMRRVAAGFFGGQIHVSRSLDGAATWGAFAPLDAGVLPGDVDNRFPSIATDGSTWLVVWDIIDLEGGSPWPFGRDSDLVSARSTNAGATWSSPALLNNQGAADKGDDVLADLATDGAGTWLAIWESSDSLGNTLGSDYDVLVASSSDGMTWSAPEPVDRDATADTNVDVQRYDSLARVVAGSAGSWTVSWTQAEFVLGDPPSDVLIARGPVPGCDATPIPGCLAAGKAALKINETVPGKESLKAALGGFGNSVGLPSLGDPVTGGSSYRVCFYDEADALVGEMVVPRAGGICGSNFKACWQLVKGTTYTFGDRTAWSGGVRRLKAQSGAAEQVKVVVKGKNKTAQFPTGMAAALAGSPGARVQVTVDDGECLEAALTTVSLADGFVFSATR